MQFKQVLEVAQNYAEESKKWLISAILCVKINLPTSTILDWSSIMSTSSDLDTNARIFSRTNTASGNRLDNSATLSIQRTDRPSSERSSKNPS